MDNSIFNSARFGAYVRLYLGSNGRKLVLTACAMAIFFIIVNFLYILVSMIFPDKIEPNFMWDTCVEWGSVFFVMLASVAGTMMYYGMSTPSERLAEIELPASEFEKFLTWFLIYVPCFLLTLFIAFYVGDAVRVLILHWFIPGGTVCRMVAPSHLLNLGLSVYAAIFFTQSLFALGSITFHRLAFLKTLCTLFVLNSICGLAMVASIYCFFGTGGLQSRFAGQVGNLETLDTVMGICVLALSVFLQWLAYRRYKEAEIISRW